MCPRLDKSDNSDFCNYLMNTFDDFDSDDD